MLKTSSSSGAYVVDLGTGQEIYARKPDVDRMPASVEKLYTSAGALLRYGPEGTLTTQVLAAGAAGRRPARSPVTSYLRGGGDPTLRCTALGQRRAADRPGGLEARHGRVIGDESAFDAFRGVPSSDFRLTSEVGPLSALSYNRGRTGEAGRTTRRARPASPRRPSRRRSSARASRSPAPPAPASPRRA